jgi:hypothetical protein
MLHLAQDKNRARFDAAREALAASRLVGDKARCESRKKFSDENASYAGFVTLTQADATFLDLNVHAFDTMGNAFAEFTTLQIGESALYKEREEYPIGVNIGHLGAGPPAQMFQTAQNGVQVQTFQYFSKKFLVPNLVNAQYNLSKFKEKDQALERVARDMRLARQQYVINTMLNQPLSTPLATSIANYYALSPGPFNNRTPFVLDAGVQAGAYVTTNVLNAAAEGGLTKNVFQEIVNYCRLCPESNGGATVPRSFFFAKAGSPWIAYWNQASIVGYSAVGSSNLDTTKAIPANKWDEAIGMSFESGGAYMNWFGTNLFCQPVNNLPQGYGLVATNKPAVLGWDQLENSVSNEGPSGLEDINMNNRYEARSIGLAQPDTLLPNSAVIKYS